MRMGYVSSVMAIAIATCAVGACSKNNQTTTPTAPSSSATGGASGPSTGISGGATIAGTVVTGTTSAAMALPTSLRAIGSANLKVSVSGTSVSSLVDGAGNFELQNVPPGDQTLVVSGGGVSAQLTITGVSMHEDIHVTILANGSTATLDDDDRETPDNRVEVEGRITSVSGSTLVVGRRAVSVIVPPGTPIHHGSTVLTFAALSPGVRVHIQATRTGTTITATDVAVQTDTGESGQNGNNDDHGGGDNHATELTGTVAGLSGTCPALTFMLGTTTVMTTASTKFEDVTCATLANGARVEVTGTKQSSGTVVASAVEKP
jgi:hypothetical protein